MQVVGEMSLADNGITALPSDLSGWKGLQKLHLYGNALETLPVDALLDIPTLQQVGGCVHGCMVCWGDALLLNSHYGPITTCLELL